MRMTRERNVALEDVASSAESSSDPSIRAISDEEATLVCRALKQLPFEQREVILLHLKGQMTFREIAERQRVSTNTVQSRYRYGIRKLRTLLRPERDGDVRK